MNEEHTITLQLGTHQTPSGDVQHFVDDLVRMHEERSLKAKVIQSDNTDRVRVPVLNLDTVDMKLTEEDILSARIFPSPDATILREEMYKEIDAIVENYANMIIEQSKKFIEYLPRIYAFIQCATVQLLTHSQAFAIKVLSTVRSSIEQRDLDTPTGMFVESTYSNSAHSVPSVSKYAHVPAPETYTEPHSDVLVYSYCTPEDVRAVVVSPQAPPSSDHLAPMENHIHEIQSKQEPIRWSHVAQCLYLEFRYGSKK